MGKHYLHTVNWGIPPVIVYKGVLVEKVEYGFKVLNTITDTPKGVDNAIKEAKKHLYKSIK